MVTWLSRSMWPPAVMAALAASSVAKVTKAKSLRSPLRASFGVCTSMTGPKAEKAARISSAGMSRATSLRWTFLPSEGTLPPSLMLGLTLKGWPWISCWVLRIASWLASLAMVTYAKPRDTPVILSVTIAASVQSPNWLK